MRQELKKLSEENPEEYKQKWDECVGPAKDLFDRVSALLQYHPAILQYFGLCELKPVKDPLVTLRLNVRGTGTYIHLEYNPIWVCEMEEATIMAYICYSECLRIALHHITLRKATPIQLFKKASDYICFDEKQRGICNVQKDIVNEILQEFPTVAKFKEETKKLKFNGEEDWFLEKVFSMLMDCAEPNSMAGGEGEEGDDSQGQGNGQGQGNSKGKGKSQKGQGNGSGNKFKDAIKEYLDSSAEAAEKATEGWEENAMVDQEIQEITKHIAEQNSSWGNISGGLLQAILAANTPKFDPTTVLKRFKANTIDKYTMDTRMRPDRRKGFDVPGKVHKYRSRILIAIDCSGSMGDDDVERGCAIVNKFVKHADVFYCFWDGECGPFEMQKRPKSDFQLIGRGCTNPECVLEAIVERKAKFDGIIYFTDMEFNFDRPDRFANKIFMISTPGHEDEIPEWCNYHLTTEQLFECE